MEFELGLKITSEADGFVSDFQIAKDRTGPVFLSQETEALFILTGHLKGYNRGNVKIDINEDGTLLTVSGERSMKETVVVGQRVYKNDNVIKRFKKVFRIPVGVILDEINAQFNEESTLMITMPKKVKVIHGTSIDEVEEQPELAREGSSNLDSDRERDGKTAWDDTTDDQIRAVEPVEPVDHETEQDMDRERDGKTVRDDTTDDQIRAVEPVKPVDHETEQDDQQESHTQDSNKTNDAREEETKDEEGQDGEPRDGPEREQRDKKCKICIPIVAGSTLLLSFVVFVIHMIRSKNHTSRRRD